MLKTLFRSALAVFLLLPAHAGAEPVTLKFSFYTSDRSNIYLYSIKPFIDAVNTEGKGVVEIEAYFSGAISAAQLQQPELVTSGQADIAFIVPGYFPERFPDSAVLQLPGLFHDESEATHVFSRLADAGALTGFQDFFVIGAFVSASETINSRKRTASLADLKGQTIRVNNAVQINTLQKLGAIPVMLPINSTMDSLSQGKIDAATVPPAMLFEFGFGRVTSNHYLLEIGAVPTALVMNRQKFESLPPQARAIIRKYSGNWLSKQSAASYTARNKEVIAQITTDPRRNIVAPTDADRETSQRVFDSVIEQWAQLRRGNRDLLAHTRAEIARFRKGDN